MKALQIKRHQRRPLYNEDDIMRAYTYFFLRRQIWVQFKNQWISILKERTRIMMR